MLNPICELTFIVPCLNEDKGIGPTIEKLIRLSNKYQLSCEILAINDGSSDRTKEVIQSYSIQHPEIKLIDHQTSQGLGYSYKEGFNMAKGKYCLLVTGDNLDREDQLAKVIALRGQSDIIIPYFLNFNDRHFFRRAVSICFTKLVQLFSGIPIKYFNGNVLHKTELLKKTVIKTDSFAYQAEIIIRMVKQGKSYQQVGITCDFNEAGSHAFKLKNIIQVVLFIYWSFSNRFKSARGKKYEQTRAI